MTYGIKSWPKTESGEKISLVETHRILSNGGGESINVAVQVRSRCDIFEAHEEAPVQPGVEETERGLALRD